MLQFVFVQKQDVNKEGLKHGEMNSCNVYAYCVHFRPDTCHSTASSGERWRPYQLQQHITSQDVLIFSLVSSPNIFTFYFLWSQLVNSAQLYSRVGYNPAHLLGRPDAALTESRRAVRGELMKIGIKGRNISRKMPSVCHENSSSALHKPDGRMQKTLEWD